MPAHKVKIRNNSASIDVNLVLIFTSNSTTQNFHLNEGGHDTGILTIDDGTYALVGSDDTTDEVVLLTSFPLSGAGLRVTLIDKPASPGQLEAVLAVMPPGVDP
jgi:hypothetical protein